VSVNLKTGGMTGWTRYSHFPIRCLGPLVTVMIYKW